MKTFEYCKSLWYNCLHSVQRCWTHIIKFFLRLLLHAADVLHGQIDPLVYPAEELSVKVGEQTLLLLKSNQTNINVSWVTALKIDPHTNTKPSNKMNKHWLFIFLNCTSMMDIFVESNWTQHEMFYRFIPCGWNSPLYSAGQTTWTWQWLVYRHTYEGSPSSEEVLSATHRNKLYQLQDSAKMLELFI